MNIKDAQKSERERLLTKRQAAAELSVCVSTLENLVATKKLIAVKINSAIRFDPADLRAYIESAKY